MKHNIRIQGIDHINLSTRDLSASIDFYQNLLGFNIREDHREEQRPYVIMGHGRRTFLAIHQRADTQAPEHPFIGHWGFVVGDLEKTRESLRAQGLTWLYAEHNDGLVEYPDSRSSYIADPDGHEIELVEVFGGGN